MARQYATLEVKSKEWTLKDDKGKVIVSQEHDVRHYIFQQSMPFTTLSVLGWDVEFKMDAQGIFGEPSRYYMMSKQI